ncbi:DUF1905 domain-containing protein [Knoellia sp. CPCC 206435]|uniref:DUF1905 domain-containing protein n=1 Tax=Knoellia terrae TaxID=3404797 RepID=UPI003B429425
MPDRSFTGAPYPASDQPDSWVFVDLPPEVADEMAYTRAEPASAFGSVRVTVRIGTQEWQTSVFPSRQRSTYVLPVRKSVRRALGVEPGDEVDVTVSW